MLNVYRLTLNAEGLKLCRPMYNRNEMFNVLSKTSFDKE